MSDSKFTLSLVIHSLSEFRFTSGEFRELIFQVEDELGRCLLQGVEFSARVGLRVDEAEDTLTQ